MNNAVISGKILADPEMRTTNDQRLVTSFPLEVAGLKDGDPSHTLKVTAWGSLAQETVEKWKKGDVVSVVGRVGINNWERTEGVTDKVAEFTASKILASLPDSLLNIVNMVGRMGNDADIKYFESGSVVAKVNIAVDRASKSKEPDWVSIEAWGKPAEVIGNYARKGTLLGVTGSIKWEVWTDKKSGVERSKPVLRVDSVRLLGGKNDKPAGDEPNFDDTPW